MDDYTLAPWHDLFQLAGGACATLAGLIFVAVALNHEEILQSKTLPSLAARTLTTLIANFIMSVLLLAPVHSRTELGTEVFILGAVLTSGVIISTTHATRTSPLRWRLPLLAVAIVSSTPMIIGGVSILVAHGGGLTWLMTEIITGTSAAVYYAWILLIEIRR